MTEKSNLIAVRDRHFAQYQRAALTKTDVTIAFYQLLGESPNDDVALSLCEGLPVWFQQHLRISLTELAGRDYFVRWFSIGDARTPEQVDADAQGIRETLMRLAPQIQRLLSSTA